eukprot:scaffold18116_cov123-Isochrysis_galbana.AAC.5
MCTIRSDPASRRTGGGGGCPAGWAARPQAPTRCPGEGAWRSGPRSAVRGGQTRSKGRRRPKRCRRRPWQTRGLS